MIAFVVCLFYNVYEETYEKKEFDEQYFMETAGLDADEGKGGSSKVNPDKETELVN